VANQYTAIVPGTVNRLGKQDKTLRKLDSKVGASSKDGAFDRVKLTVDESTKPKVLEGLKQGSLRGIVYDVLNKEMATSDDLIVNHFTLGYSAKDEASTDATKQKFVKVRVWIPELHQCMVMPNFIKKYTSGATTGLTAEEKYNDYEIMKCYPICTAKVEDLDNIVPDRGDLIEVSFTSKDYDSGIIEKVLEQNPHASVLSDALGLPSAREAHQNSESTVDDINPTLIMPTIRSETTQIWNSLPPGGTGGPSSSNLVVFTSRGKPAIKNTALLSFIQMLLDFQENSPGTPIDINSAYRDLQEDYTFNKIDATALTESSKYNVWNGNRFVSFANVADNLKKKGTLSSSQKSLRIKNCFPEENYPEDVKDGGIEKWKKIGNARRMNAYNNLESGKLKEDILYRKMTCKPATAPIAQTKNNTSHFAGLAFDIQVYTEPMKNTSKFPKNATATVPLSSQYQWLLENCWKYGFKRTVSSERWHFEFKPGAKYYSGSLVLNHPTYDGSGAKKA